MKVGHGGTLDPLATGVLIVGVGRGTKHLQQFLTDSTKCYETTLLFGAATDTYDTSGQLLGEASVDGVSRAKVEYALAKFRGDIMQRPPPYSALRVQGKRLYEYAREGKELPAEIQERPVTLKEICVTEWLETHSQRLEPSSIEDPREKTEFARRNSSANKWKLDGSKLLSGDTDLGTTAGQGGEPPYEATTILGETPLSTEVTKSALHQNSVLQNDDEFASVPAPDSMLGGSVSLADQNHFVGPPAVKLRMTVTSGFYVRSLCHDLGKAVGSLGVMGSLARVRQGRFELGKNVLAYEDFNKSEETWGPKLSAMLEDWIQSIESTTQST